MEKNQVRHIAKRLPKVQLHLHLDGSLPESLVCSLADKYDVKLPVRSEQLRLHFLSVKSHQLSTDSYKQKPSGNWDNFNFINSLLRAPEDLYLATKEIINDVKQHNVVLLEIRYCPTLYSFTPDEAVQAVINAFKEDGLKGGVILCALRSYPSEHLQQIISLASKYRHNGVIGIDLAGDEGSYPLSPYINLLKHAVKEGINVTVHAGEWGSSASQNLQDALSVPVKRLGHALALRDPKLRQIIGDTFVETCITANCSGRHKVPADEFRLHPLKDMLKDGVKVAGFNCDNLLLSGTISNRPDPTEEIVRARSGCGLNWRQIEAVLVDGVKASFDTTVFDKEEHGSFLERFEREVREILVDVIGE